MLDIVNVINNDKYFNEFPPSSEIIDSLIYKSEKFHKNKDI
jgi:hypothetical protein